MMSPEVAAVGFALRWVDGVGRRLLAQPFLPGIIVLGFRLGITSPPLNADGDVVGGEGAERASRGHQQRVADDGRPAGGGRYWRDRRRGLQTTA